MRNKSNLITLVLLCFKYNFYSAIELDVWILFTLSVISLIFSYHLYPTFVSALFFLLLFSEHKVEKRLSYKLHKKRWQETSYSQKLKLEGWGRKIYAKVRSLKGPSGDQYLLSILQFDNIERLLECIDVLSVLKVLLWEFDEN